MLEEKLSVITWGTYVLPDGRPIAVAHTEDGDVVPLEALIRMMFQPIPPEERENSSEFAARQAYRQAAGNFPNPVGLEAVISVIDKKTKDLCTALALVLDQVDYTRGACGLTEMVGAVLSKEVIALARRAIDEAV